MASCSKVNPEEQVTMDEEQKKGLTITQVLQLLCPKVQHGRGLPSTLTSPPWRIPTSSHPRAEDINVILSHSMEVQSSTIPESGGDFDSFIISNAGLAVAGLLKNYLTALGLGESETRVVFGILLWDAGAREDADDYEGTPHVWLDIAGHPIDNTHVALPEQSELHLEYFYKAKQANYYRRENPLTTKLKLYLGTVGQDNSTTMHNLRVFRTYISEGADNLNVEKYLVFALQCADLNPTVKMYDLLMRGYLKKQFGLEPVDLVQKWSSKCWNCGKSPDNQDDLKTCTDCKHAKYCGRECQKQEWKAHKLLHKELELTKKVLEQSDEEEYM